MIFGIVQLHYKLFRYIWLISNKNVSFRNKWLHLIFSYKFYCSREGTTRFSITKKSSTEKKTL
jgi:hypothetical protein